VFDGVVDGADAFPLDKLETVDTDGDGIGNKADTDDDGDGLSDAEEDTAGTDPLLSDTDNDTFSDFDEITCESNPLENSAKPTDTDMDGLCDDGVDSDDDNDGVADSTDTFPLNGVF
jgi:hypothetical protein